MPNPTNESRKRVEVLLERLGSNLTEVDFALLAVECANQAGLSLGDLAIIAQLLADGQAPRVQDQIRAQAQYLSSIPAVAS